MMKKIRNIVVFLACFSFSANISHAQYDDIANFLRGGVKDAETLFEAYLTPYANAFGSNLSGGWYNTAKVHKKFGFDINVSVSMSFVPDVDKEFDFRELEGINKLRLSDESNFEIPTAASKEKGVSLDWYENIPGMGEERIASFKTPDGTKIGFLPAPMIQGGIGLLYGTDLNIRYMPTVTVAGDGEVGLWGLGLKHSLKQWIPVIKRIPILHVSLQAGYTKLNSTGDITFLPDNLHQNAQLPEDIDMSVFDDQSIDFTMSSLTANALVSANLPVVSFYGGIGFISSSSELKLNGTFPVGLNVEKYESGEVEVVTEENPITMSFGSKAADGFLPRLNAGIRFKLGVVTIHGDYTYSDYSMVTAGLGVTFR